MSKDFERLLFKDWLAARRARAAGCYFSIPSRSHAPHPTSSPALSKNSKLAATLLLPPIPLMDSVFLLSPEARARLLQRVAHTLGCIYICLWSYLPHPSNCLISTDGWYHKDDSSLSRRQFFDNYRGSFCSVETGCVPGLAYKEGHSYIELENSDLMKLASLQVQRQFYQEVGIKKAVFIGCQNGEIELGVSTLSNINMQLIQQLFNEDFVQQSQFPDQSHPSSSSSSLRSLSVGSPEYSSIFLNKATPSFSPDTLKEVTAEQPTRAPIAALDPLHQMAKQAYSRHHNVQFPTPASDDAAMTRAMLAVISSTSSSSSPFVYHWLQQDQAHQSKTSCCLRAFKPYNSALAPKFEANPRLGGHKMIKMGISILRRINMVRAEARVQESRPPTINQLQHMISERKRREKLNESFHALRMLLPPGSKKDRASVLSNIKDFVNTLGGQISELEERNRLLEMQLLPTDEIKKVGDSNERVEVQIIHASESTSEMQRISLRLTVRAACDMIELVLRVLECLKEMGVVSLISVNASMHYLQANIFARVNLTLQVKGSDWDEESFKEAVTQAADGVLVARSATTNP